MCFNYIFSFIFIECFNFPVVADKNFSCPKKAKKIMTIHVACDPFYGNVIYYDDETKTYTDMYINILHDNTQADIDSLFEEIKSKITLVNQKLECICFCLNSEYGSQIRKHFIEIGLNYGYEKIKIINWKTAVFLTAVSQTNYKFENSDVIWLTYGQEYYVWKINDGKAKFIYTRDLYFHLSRLYDYDVERKKLNKLPNILIYRNGNDFDKMFKKKIVEDIQGLKQPFKFDNYTYDGMDSYLKGCIIKALIADDEDLNPAEIDARNTESIDLSNIHLITCINNLFIREKPDNKLKGGYTIPKKEILNQANLQAMGIDLGTSRCCAAVNRKNGITTVPLDNTGDRLLPSYVAYDEEHVKCGKVVVNRLRNFSKSTIFDSKRIIGRKSNDIEIDENWNFAICFENDQVYMKVNGFNNEEKNVTAEKVAADLLKHIKQKAEEFQGTRIFNAVITVPAAFTEEQKDATEKAAKLAGWNEIVLLPEPIAAAFAYFIDRPILNNSNVLLFDLGGGTLDVCIFKITYDEIQFISNTGDSNLGGRDFDTVLINYFKNLLSTKHGITNLKDKKYKLLVECQRIKEDLSATTNSSLEIDEFDAFKDGIISITREEFEKIAKTLLNRIENTIQSALFKSDHKTDQINKVLQVGGGSRMPMIKNLLKEMFPHAEHCCEEHPDEVVAIGAAYYAYHIFAE